MRKLRISDRYHHLNQLVALEAFHGLRFRNVHIQDLLLQEKEGALPLQRAQAVSLRGIGILVKQNQERQKKDQRTDADHQKHRALVHQPAQRQPMWNVRW